MGYFKIYDGCPHAILLSEFRKAQRKKFLPKQSLGRNSEISKSVIGNCRQIAEIIAFAAVGYRFQISRLASVRYADA